VSCVRQTGGCTRDADVIAARNDYGDTMMCSSVRLPAESAEFSEPALLQLSSVLPYPFCSRRTRSDWDILCCHRAIIGGHPDAIDSIGTETEMDR